MNSKNFSQADLRVWVNDSLHDVAGISDKTIADFMIGLAKQSKSSTDFIEKIRETETLDITSALSTFANELYQKIPRGGTGTGNQTVGQKRQIENRAREQAAKELAAKNQSYKLLSDDEDDIQVYYWV